MSNQPCPRCGRTVAIDAPGGLCASCLLEAGAETYSAGSSSTDFMPTMTSAGPGVVARRAPRLTEGDRWGGYRIGRLLGRGGMGEVYDAEHLSSGRRVALKVLSSPLQSAEERARFLREGQLAASVSHPHTVYIFGSEEIEGTPVISMELLPGGTLKDRVVANGPMRPDEAVAAVMELVGGLDAAAAAGILHRDIKPSNCFVDRDGVVKVGDLGLSISTLARDVHQQLETSGFEGTPQFAPPEQLRGEPLDVRADIYAVGATLYYLLTGRPPFDAPDLRELVPKVTSEAPVPPRQLRRDIPARLSALVVQCLAKWPSDRPASYRALADALRPFLARHDRPAPIFTRTVAGMVDAWFVVGIPVALVTMLLADSITGSPERSAAIANLGWAATIVYYLVLEGATGASLGKRLFGLCVVSGAGSPPTWPQAAARAVLFRAPDILVAAIVGSPVFYSVTERSSSGFYVNWKQTAPPLLMVLMFFATARLRNGWTGLHDVLSGTRVIARPPALERQARVVQQTAAAAIPAGSARRYGPFMALDGGESRPGDVVRAFDPVLRRQVWIEIADASKPPVDGARRDLSRPARLRWLAGRRSADDSWDAYEAPDGAGWTTAAADGAWPQLKLQLLDLANELAHAAEDGTRPPLGLDRVWLRDNGRIVLLDFPPPDAAAHAAADLTPEELLQAAASRVPRHPAEPAALPLSARAFLERWSGAVRSGRTSHARVVDAPPPTLADARTALTAMTAAPDRVHWWRRALPGALASAPAGLMLVVSVAILPALDRFASSDTNTMMNLLGALRSTTLTADNPLREPEVRAAAEVAIAGRYAQSIRDEEFWNAGVVRALAPEYRSLAEDILTRHPDVSPAQLAAAEEVLKEARSRGPVQGRREQSALALGGVIISTLTAWAFALVLVACVISSLLVPGGLVSRQLGLATVTRSGKEITRLRSVLRTLVAGSPAIAWLAYLAFSPKVQGFVPTPPDPIAGTFLVVGVLALGHTWTVSRRTRGPHDLLTGTWVVPR
jgi:eukaryotic-like serine/threonine-protein kinase